MCDCQLVNPNNALKEQHGDKSHTWSLLDASALVYPGPEDPSEAAPAGEGLRCEIHGTFAFKCLFYLFKEEAFIFI